MAKKAANGTGHTYQRKDGRWEAKVTTGYDPATGKQLFRSIYGKTQKEVEQKKRQLLTQLENGTFTQPQKITVAEWMKEWLTNDDGECVKLFTFYKHFKQIVASIGRPDLRPHDLRHTAATVAIANGGDVKSVQSLLGHSTPTITLSLYTHASEKMARETASKVQGYYEQKLTNI